MLGEAVVWGGRVGDCAKRLLREEEGEEILDGNVIFVFEYRC